jgi:hypothetical protein
MRIWVFAALALLASGCTIHVVERPAPVMVAEVPHPAPTRIVRPRRDIEHASAAAPRSQVPRTVERPEPVQTAPHQPERTLYRTTAPEARSTPSTERLHYRRLKVKRGAEPVTRVSSTSVAKAQ